MGCGVKPSGLDPQVQLYATLSVPTQRAKEERVPLDLTGNELPQQRTAVVWIGLRAEDVYLRGRVGPRDTLGGGNASYAVADDDLLHSLPYSAFSNMPLPAPHSGQTQSSGSASKEVPGAIPLSGSPASGS